MMKTATRTHTVHLRFTESSEDRRLYAALLRTSQQEHRQPHTRQAKYLLGIALGIHFPDEPMMERMSLALKTHREALKTHKEG